MTGRSLELAAEPASSFQRGLWFLAQMDPGSPAHNFSAAWRLTGDVVPAALGAAFSRLRSRHQALRTRFADVAGTPVQVIDDPAADFALTHEVADSESEAVELLRARALVPIDLANGPVLRVTLVRCGADTWFLGVVVHRIAFDQRSEHLLIRDLAALYTAEVTDAEPALPPIGVRAAAPSDHEAARQYWESRLAECPVGLDLPRLGQESGGPVTHGIEVPAGIVDVVAQQAGCPPSTALLAVWALLLHRYSRQSDIMIGTSSPDRDVSEDIGCHQHVLPLRVDVTGDPAFPELAERVRATLRDAAANREFGFDEMVKVARPSRRGRGDSLFEVWFEATDEDLDLAVPGVRAERLALDPAAVRYPLALTARRTGDVWQLSFDCAGGEFSATTMSSLARHFDRLLAEIAADSEVPVSRIPLLSDEERAALIAERSVGSVQPVPNTTLLDLFETQTASTPDRIAVRLGETGLSYAELDASANQLAHRLRAAGVGADVRVALYLERGLEMVVAVLGVLKAGGAYVAIDQRNPKDRISAVLSEVDAPVVLTLDRVRHRLPSATAEIWPVDGVHAQAGAPAGPGSGLDPENVAYVTYTSGSTGGPKGIAMPHRAVVNLLSWQAAHYGMSQDDPPRTLQFASLAFDVSVQDMFSTWMVGGEVVLITEDERLDLARLHGVLESQRVRRLFIPAPALQQVAAGYREAGAAPAALRTIISGSEQFMATPDVRQLARVAGMSLHNEYGPSETHVVTCYDLPLSDGQWPTPVPVGAPIANAAVYVLDEHGEILPDGVIGEIHIGGEGLARGYVGKPGITAERFVPDPFAAGDGRRMYRTGDLGRWRPGGELEFLGRADFQVKIRGFRVELAEVESALESHPQVSEAVVLVRQAPAGDVRLVGYVSRVGDDVPDLGQRLRAHAATKVPDYMVPSSVVVLEKLPLTANGKIDRRALPAPRWDSPARSSRVALSTSTQQRLAEIWSAALGVAEIGGDEDFFDLGGHSLLAAEVLAEVRSSFAVDVPLHALFEYPTIAEFAEVVEKVATAVDASRREGGTSVTLPTELSRQYAEDGYFLRERLFTAEELAVLREESEAEFGRPGPQRTMEADSGKVRAVHGAHLTNQVFHDLVRDPRLLGPATELLGGDVYVHQFKINAKHGLGGGIWEWHQDFMFWQREDGMPKPDALSAVVFLDPVTEFNGPLYLVPGSHRDLLPVTFDAEEDWASTLSASLKYQIDPTALGDTMNERGIVAPLGDVGSVLFFHGQLLHGSPPNMSATSRRLMIITFNAVRNAPSSQDQTRPEFLSARDTTPLRPSGPGRPDLTAVGAAPGTGSPAPLS
ncbi:amino acid adenylation domain-containing protein [Lentzea sp. NPDC092896]|uniref:amino acid adenylation domain-containing protein n=1 Tax=Lentzea sp. NPDC092896 TaxID=3364127 RepID=UPI00380D9D00